MRNKGQRPKLGIALLVAMVMATAPMAVSRFLGPSHSGGLVASAAGGPTLTADPSSGLADWQYVKVSLTGASKGKGYAFRQCGATPKVLGSDCTVLTGVTAVADDQGNAVTYVPVWTGAHEPLLTSDDGKSSIACDVDHPCAIAAMPNQNDISTALLAPISFARSPDACPADQSGILGSGSAVAYRAIYTWEANSCLPPTNLGVSYTLHNSHDGWTNFQACATSFGVTGPFPPPDPPAGVTPPDFKFAPLTVSGLVLAYRIYDTDGLQVTNLTLTPALIARIFKGEVTNWNVGLYGQQIAALNPDVRRTRPDGTIVRFPGIINPTARGEYSAETYVFTSWLAAAAPDAWSRGVVPNATPIGAQEVFPTDLLDPGSYKTGSRAVALGVVDPFTQYDTFGNIGFMDTSTAAFYGLPTVKIKQADGSVVAASTATIQQAITNATVQADGTLRFDLATPRPDAYPMPIPTYMLAPTAKVCPDDAGPTVAAFLRYAVQAGQTLLPTGYVPLPQNLVDESLHVADLIPGLSPSASPSPSPSPSASPSPSPTASPSPSPSPSGTPGPIWSVSPQPTPSTTATPTSHATSIPTLSLPLLANPPVTDVSPGTSNPGETAATPSGGPVALRPNQHPAAIPPGQGAQLVALIRNQDSTAGAYLLPLLALLGLFCLIAGAAAQLLGRRRP